MREPLDRDSPIRDRGRGGDARDDEAIVVINLTHAFLEVLTALTPNFEKESGFKVTFGLDPSNVIKRQIEAGATFDVAIVTRAVLDDLIKQSRAAAAAY